MDKILEEQEAPGFDKATALSDDKLAFLGGVLMEGGSDTVLPLLRCDVDGRRRVNWRVLCWL
jgi:hypothetical protein